MKPQAHTSLSLQRLAKTLGVHQPTDLHSTEARHDELLARVVDALCQKQGATMFPFAQPESTSKSPSK